MPGRPKVHTEGPSTLAYCAWKEGEEEEKEAEGERAGFSGPFSSGGALLGGSGSSHYLYQRQVDS